MKRSLRASLAVGTTSIVVLSAALLALSVIQMGAAAIPTCNTSSAATSSGLGAPTMGRRAPILASVWERSTDSNHLVKLDPLSLEPLSKTIPLGPQEDSAAESLSPDGSLLAIGGRSGTLRFIDVGRMQLVGRMHLAGRGPSRDPWRRHLAIESAAWLRLRALIVTAGQLWPPHQEELFVIDPLRRRVVVRANLQGSVVRRRKARDHFVLLLSPPVGAVHAGPSRLVVVDSRGRIRSTVLQRITSGYEAVETASREQPGRQLFPALAFDPLQRRALIVGTDELVASIELDSLDVSYSEPSGGISLLDRLGGALVGNAQAKGAAVVTRTAEWVGRGLMAVTGSRFSSLDTKVEPAGLTLIDTDDWSACMLDKQATEVRAYAGTLLAFRSVPSPLTRRGGMGLVAYDATGERRWHRFARAPIQAQIVNGLLYADHGWASHRIAIVDVQTGRVINEVRTPLPDFVVH